MKNKIKIVPDPYATFIEDFSEIVEPDLFIEEFECPHCKYRIRYPLMVRKRDYEMFKRLLEMTEEVMGEMGITEKLIKKVFEKAIKYSSKKIN